MAIAFLLLTVLASWPAAAQPAAQALEATGIDVSAERASPEACVTFDRPLAPGSDLELRPFVSVTPAGDRSLSARGDRLCIGGLRHGERYGLTVRPGLSAADGTRLAAAAQFEVAVPDRAPAVRFRGRGDVLPLGGDPVLPVTSVNTDRVQLELFKIVDRSLIDRLAQGAVGMTQSGWSIAQLEDRGARRLFSGTVAIETVSNREVTTAIPLRGLLGPDEPGVYVAVARLPNAATEDWQDLPTRWFTLTDTGLLTWQGEDGLLVRAASLADGKVLADRELALMSRSNRIIASARTGADGYARFEPGELRGIGGDAPQALFVYGPAGDFTWLDFDRAGIDLTDRGVDGRTPPAALDAFLWTERGVYRPGETVQLGLMLRDRMAEAVTGLPLVLVVTRPDQVEVDRIRVEPASLGGALLPLPLAPGAFPGTWTVTAHVGDGAPAIGRVTFAVDDIVPPRLEVALPELPASLAAGQAVPVAVQADYLFGAPGADLPAEAALSLRAADAPFPAWRGWRFGLEEEPFRATGLALGQARTDAQGRVAFTAAIPELDAGRPVEASITGRVSDVDGRPVTAERVVPLVDPRGYAALQPRFDGALGENATAGFSFAAMDGVGKPVARQLAWRLFAERIDYVWVRQGTDWDVQTVVTDSLLDSGTVATGADGTVAFEHPVTSGPFRIEVSDPAGIAAASMRFSAGWWSAADETERPDRVEVVLGEQGPPDRLRVTVRPPYPARVVLMLADERIQARAEADIGKDGGVIELPRPAAIGPGGVYLLATALAAPGTARPHLPARAVGVLHLDGPVAERTLDVALDVPPTVRPETDLTVGVTLQGLAPDEPGFVTLAAVDDAVLQMTDFELADPIGFYFRQRALGITLRDLYGRLIDPEGTRGRIESGGDARMAMQFAGNEVRSYRIVSLAQGPLAVGPDGKATGTFHLPAFDGRLKLSAVAWTKSRVGSASTDVLVRGPVVADLTRPRFLAPRDEASFVLDAHHVDGPVGKWTVELSTEGPLTLEPAQPAPLDIGPGKASRRTVTARAGEVPGTATVRMKLTGPDGTVVERGFEIAVRSPWPSQAERSVADLGPQQSLTIDRTLAGDFLPGTAKAELTVGALPELGLARVVRSLADYPYGCVEQTVSQAMPLLAADRLRPELGLGVAPAEALTGLQQAVRRLVDLQNASGAFGLWSPQSPPETWLSSYVADFLERARQDVHVPATPLDRLADRLSAALGSDDATPGGLQARAYAAWVLARLGKVDVPTLRWFEGRYADQLPSDLARAQLAAALATVGDRPRAERIVAELSGERRDGGDLNDYGSALRDAAASFAVLNEAGLLAPAERDRRIGEIAAAYGDPAELSTQEQAWILRAGVSLLDEPGEAPKLAVNGEEVPPAAGPLRITRELSADMAPLVVENRGDTPLYRTLVVSGLPVEPQPPAEMGFRLKRRVLSMAGKPLPQRRDAPGTFALTQGDRVVVLLEGSLAQTGNRQVLLVDLLPAGLEIEPVRLEGTVGGDELNWLGELTQPVARVSRDDRFAAALDGWSKTFRLAYVARATTPGRFVWPSSRVEDMFDPAAFARTAAGRLVVDPAK